MALKPCKECGHNVASGAKVCPNCGIEWPAGNKPISTTLGCFIIILVFVAIAAITGGDSSDPTPTAGTRAEPSQEDLGYALVGLSKQLVKGVLKDPESAKFGVIQVFNVTNDGKTAMMACGSVNSKNGFGGYTGPKRFISVGTVEGTFFEESAESNVFEGTWELACSGTPFVTSRAE